MASAFGPPFLDVLIQTDERKRERDLLALLSRVLIREGIDNPPMNERRLLCASV